MTPASAVPARSSVRVAWEVATECGDKVDIFFSMEGKRDLASRKPIKLARGVPNSGEHQMLMPEPDRSLPYQLTVECSSHIRLRRNILVLNGNRTSGDYTDYTFSTLDDEPVDGRSDSCQKDFKAVPTGWRLVPDNEETRQKVAASKPWNTHLLILEGGKGYGTGAYAGANVENMTPGKAFSQGVRWEREIDRYRVPERYCHAQIAIMTEGPKAAGTWPSERGLDVVAPVCERVRIADRLDCGEPGFSPAQCGRRGCCFDRRTGSAPQCYRTWSRGSLRHRRTQAWDAVTQMWDTVLAALASWYLFFWTAFSWTSFGSGSVGALVGSVWMSQRVEAAALRRLRDATAKGMASLEASKEEAASLRRTMRAATHLLGLEPRPAGELACIICHVNDPQVSVRDCNHQSTCAPCLARYLLDSKSNGREPKCMQCQQPFVGINMPPILAGVPVVQD